MISSDEVSWYQSTVTSVDWVSDIRNDVSRNHTLSELSSSMALTSETAVSMQRLQRSGLSFNDSHRDDYREVDKKQSGCCPAKSPHSAV